MAWPRPASRSTARPRTWPCSPERSVVGANDEGRADVVAGVSAGTITRDSEPRRVITSVLRSASVRSATPIARSSPGRRAGGTLERGACTAFHTEKIHPPPGHARAVSSSHETTDSGSPARTPQAVGVARSCVGRRLPNARDASPCCTRPRSRQRRNGAIARRRRRRRSSRRTPSAWQRERSVPQRLAFHLPGSPGLIPRGRRGSRDAGQRWTRTARPTC
jgi:hypothetical protein